MSASTAAGRITTTHHSGLSGRIHVLPYFASNEGAGLFLRVSRDAYGLFRPTAEAESLERLQEAARSGQVGCPGKKVVYNGNCFQVTQQAVEEERLNMIKYV